jgi:membrane-bound ClpP family serine protease
MNGIRDHVTTTMRKLLSRGSRRALGGPVGWLVVAAVLAALLPDARADDGPCDGLFVTVHNPITSEVTSRVKEITTRAVDRFQEAERAAEAKEKRTFKIVFDFNPATQGGQAAPSGTRDFGPCQDLAEHILKLQDVTTIAFVRSEVYRHTVLPVLACKEIVMSQGASIGDVLREQMEPLSNSKREAYRETIRGRRCPAIVMKMLDKDMVVLKARKLEARNWYIDARNKVAEAKNGIIVVDRNPVIPSGEHTTLFTADQAREYELCQPFFLETRQQLAEKYQLPPTSLREDPLMGRSPVAWRIDVRGPVNGALAETLRRRIRRAIGQHANLIILQLDCGGGDTQVAVDLAKDLRELKDDRHELPVMTVAYIPQQAPDTATILALGCTEIVMNKDAELGDFGQFIYERRDGQLVEVGADRNRMRMKALEELAEEQGYSPVLIRGMMDPHVRIYWASNLKDARERRFLTEEDLTADKRKPEPTWGREVQIKPGPGGEDGKPLILRAELAKELSLVRHTVDNLNDVYALYGLNPSQVHMAGPDWLDELALFLRSSIMSVILVLVGITCLILELKMPGVGVPGVIAAICFVLFFWSHSQLAGQITMLAVLLFVLGLVLIALEVFVLPGFGVAGISGILLVLVSLALVTVEKKPETSQEWLGLAGTMATFGMALLAAIPLAIALAWYLPHIPYVNRLILKPEAEQTDALGEPFDTVRPEIAALLGAIGVAATPLRPAGKVQFGEEYVDVVAESGYVVPGTRVQVVEIEGNRIVVKEV